MSATRSKSSSSNTENVRPRKVLKAKPAPAEDTPAVSAVVAEEVAPKKTKTRSAPKAPKSTDSAPASLAVATEAVATTPAPKKTRTKKAKETEMLEDAPAPSVQSSEASTQTDASPVATEDIFSAMSLLEQNAFLRSAVSDLVAQLRKLEQRLVAHGKAIKTHGKSSSRKSKRPASEQSAEAPAEPKAKKVPSGITQPVPISAELRNFIEKFKLHNKTGSGVPDNGLLASASVTSYIKDYVTAQSLWSKKADGSFFKKEFRVDAELKALLAGNPKFVEDSCPTVITYPKTQQYLSHHFRRSVPEAVAGA